MVTLQENNPDPHVPMFWPTMKGEVVVTVWVVVVVSVVVVIAV